METHKIKSLIIGLMKNIGGYERGGPKKAYTPYSKGLGVENHGVYRNEEIGKRIGLSTLSAPGNVRVLLARFSDEFPEGDQTAVYQYSVTNKSYIEEAVMPLDEVQMREVFRLLDQVGMTLGLYRLGLEIGGADFHLAIRRGANDLYVYNNRLKTIQHMSDFERSKFQNLLEWDELIDISRFDVFTREKSPVA